MEAAKNAVKGFMHRAGQHDTTVHEEVAPAVTHETVTKTQHEHATTAVDKEVHQDHFHTSVQPIKDQEVLPETHHHNLAAVEYKTFEHGEDDARVKARLAAERAKYKDESMRVEGKHTATVDPVVAGEHVHHHVHETIQPVVQKSTIEPHVIHTTIPVHEVHHNAAQHHAATALPAVSMSEFKRQGGSLTGREERKDGFKGEPRSVGKALGGAEAALTGNKHAHARSDSGVQETARTTAA